MTEELKLMLELAAKAAGIDGAYDPWKQEFRRYFDGQRIFLGDEWRPLTDDGDALRLAVKLQIQVTPGTYNKDEFTAFKAGSCEAHEFRHYKQDEFAATRLAIVRAAAAIGEAMP